MKGVGLHWQPIDKHFLSGDVSSVPSVLKEAFGQFPLSLNRTDLKMLSSTAENQEDPSVYNELAEAILKHGMITVSFSY